MAQITRRQFLGQGSAGVCAAGMLTVEAAQPAANSHSRAKRVIILHQSGGPSQLDTFDYKPALRRFHGKSVAKKSGVIAASPFNFERSANGAISDLLPHIRAISDELCIVRSLQTTELNHDSALTLLQTGQVQPGHVSLGAQVGTALASAQSSAPPYAVFISNGSGNREDQPIYPRLWNGGVKCESGGSDNANAMKLYGADIAQPGTYAANCLAARQMAEDGAHIIQLFHRGWDQHGDLATHLPKQCRDVDRATAGLIQDLKMRGMLADTLVVWVGEFGRAPFAQGVLTNFGRDHQAVSTCWLAGGGVKSGSAYGATDDLGCTVAENPVSIHDLHATILHCMGMTHSRGHVVESILA